MIVLIGLWGERLGERAWTRAKGVELTESLLHPSRTIGHSVGQKEYLPHFSFCQYLVWLWSGFSSSHAGKRHPSKPSWEMQGEEADH